MVKITQKKSDQRETELTERDDWALAQFAFLNIYELTASHRGRCKSLIKYHCQIIVNLKMLTIENL